MSEFRHFVVRNKEIWEKGDITDPHVLMNDAKSKFKSLQEDKLWITKNLTKAKMLALTTFIENLTRQLDSKGSIKQSNKSFRNSTPSIFAPGNNETWDAPKPGESRTKMVGKQLRNYCGKFNRGRGFWSWHEEKNHIDNYVPKAPYKTHKHENSGTPQLQLADDMKKALNTLSKP